MANTNEIIGYRIVREGNWGLFVDYNPVTNKNYYTSRPPVPIASGDALRRLAAFMDENAGYTPDDFSIEPVYRELKPIEAGARELSGLLKSLCARHGLELGLTDEQIQAQIERELRGYGAR